MSFVVSADTPEVQEFLSLREAVGWRRLPHGVARQALDNSLFCVTVRDAQELIGVGRVVGDGAVYFYVQDVAVLPSRQGHGVGHALMAEIDSYLSAHAGSGASIGLLAAEGKEAFYAQYGYVERTGQPLGKGMCKFV